MDMDMNMDDMDMDMDMDNMDMNMDMKRSMLSQDKSVCTKWGCVTSVCVLE